MRAVAFFDPASKETKVNPVGLHDATMQQWRLTEKVSVPAVDKYIAHGV